MAHAGLAETLSTLDPDAADRHAREGSRLFTAMGAVDPYHMADDDKPSDSRRERTPSGTAMSRALNVLGRSSTSTVIQPQSAR